MKQFNLGDVVYFVGVHSFLIDGDPKIDEDEEQWNKDYLSGKRFVSEPMQITGLHLMPSGRVNYSFTCSGSIRIKPEMIFTTKEEAQAEADRQNRERGIE